MRAVSYAVILLAALTLCDYLVIHAATIGWIPTNPDGLGLTGQLPEISLFPAIWLLVVSFVCNRVGLIRIPVGIVASLGLAAVNTFFVGCAPIFTSPGACT
jgi:hypothetical protein